MPFPDLPESTPPPGLVPWFDPAQHRWNPYTSSVEFKDGSGSLSFADAVAAMGGTRVMLSPGFGPVEGTATTPGENGWSSMDFAPGETPFFGFPGDGGTNFVSSDPNAISQYRENERTRNLQGAVRVGALVGGGAALGGALGPAGGAGAASGAATTYPVTTGPLATGGTVTAAPIAAGGGAAAGAGGLAVGPNGLPTAAIGGGGSVVPSTIKNWFSDPNNWLPIAGNLASGVIGSNAAGNASDAMAEANRAAIDESRRQYDTTRTDLLPWLDAGRSALGRLSDPNASFTASPDYAFVRGEGTRGIENTFSAKGGVKSGNALRALADYTTNLASGEFGNWWNRQAGLAGVGQTTATQLGTFGANNATRVGSYMADTGDTRASGILGRGAVASNTLDDLINNYLYSRGRRNSLPVYGGG